MLVELPPDQQEELWKDVRFKPMPASTYAKKALNAIAKNEGIIIIPFWWRFLWWIDRLSPRLGILMAQKSHQYMQNLVNRIQQKE